MPFSDGPHRNAESGFYCVMMNARRIRWVGHVVYMGEKKSTEF
jgi:hypothetical protein